MTTFQIIALAWIILLLISIIITSVYIKKEFNENIFFKTKCMIKGEYSYGILIVLLLWTIPFFGVFAIIHDIIICRRIKKRKKLEV